MWQQLTRLAPRRYTILDTGSTDGTPELIKEAFGGVPGEVSRCTRWDERAARRSRKGPQVHNGEFMDFSTTRNRVLELAGLRCVFTLMLSGDERWERGAAALAPLTRMPCAVVCVCVRVFASVQSAER